MNRIAGRSWALLLMIGLLLGGLSFFCYEYFQNSEAWTLHSGNPHVYEEQEMAVPAVRGTMVDRFGNLLLRIDEKWAYSVDPATRMAMLHWTGDRSGNIRDALIHQYTSQMLDFDPVNGLYNYGGQDGKMTLTLSAQVQAAALKAMGDYKGTVAVYNYRTGELLCAVTTPTFDPDAVPDFSGDTTGRYEGVYLNRFLQSAYIPGSIFKLVTTAAALQEIPDIQAQTFECTGSLSFGPDKVTCEIAHGKLTLKTAMQRSCNCAYAQIALQLGKETLQKYVDAYGVLESVNFDGLSTVKGNFSVENAAAVELAWSAIGQHRDQINPCAYLTFVGAIAAGGQAVRPYVVERVEVGPKVTYQSTVTQLERIMPEETAAVLQTLMRNNVVNHYGQEHFHGLTVCAKTGTGQVDGGKKPNATFTGFVTDEEYPLAFIVCVEDGGYGRLVCIPIISAILESCIQVMDS